jgi:plasmid stabilization system protein ParE
VLRVDLHPEAEEDLSEAAQYIDRDRPGWGERLDDAVQAAEDLIATYPKIGKSIGRRARRVDVHGFKYSLIYQLFPDSILVLAIAHDSRSPRFWRHRVR